MKRLSIKDKPEWFSAEKYSGTGNLDISGWYRNLRLRNRMLFSPDDQEIAKLEAYLKTAKSLIDDQGQPEDISGKPKGLYEGTEAEGLCAGTVYSMPAEAIVDWVFACLESESGPYREIYEAAERLSKTDLVENGDTFPDLYSRYMHIPIDMLEDDPLQRRAFPLAIFVDIHASDQVLQDDFAKWLRVARSRFGLSRQKLVSQSDLSDWCRFKILEYCDLRFWAHRNSLKISDAVMGNLLFPDEFDVDLAERIRKVIRPKADRLLNFNFLQALKLQIESPEP